MKVLIDQKRVERRIAELADQLAADYGNDSPLFIGILNGAAQFMIELIARLPAPLQERLEYDFIDISSYDGDSSRGEVTLVKDCVVDVRGKRVVVVDGIVDTGLTLDHVLTMLEERQPQSVKVCALLDKPARRERQVPIDYCGFTIEDLFVVGYGMDYDQRYRALRYVGFLE